MSCDEGVGGQLQAGAYACDLTGHGTFRIAGGSARDFLSAMFTGDMDACRGLADLVQGLVLTGQGEVIDVASVFCTGDDEYLLLASPENRAELFEWLSAHAKISDDDGPVFPQLELDDASGQVAVLMLYGPESERTYESLAQALDGRVALVSHGFSRPAFGVPMLPARILFVPVNAAGQIGDFLAARLELEALALDEYRAQALQAGAYAPGLEEARYATPVELGLEGLLRASGGYVGQRALETGG